MQLIQQDYDFIKEDWDDNYIKSIPKDIFITKMKEKVHKAAFEYYLLLKEHVKLKWNI